MERLNQNEIDRIIEELKENGKYREYHEMILDDYEEHKVAYKLDENEMIALAYKNNTIPFKMLEYYDWQLMNVLVEEDDGSMQF